MKKKYPLIAYKKQNLISVTKGLFFALVCGVFICNSTGILNLQDKDSSLYPSSPLSDKNLQDKNDGNDLTDLDTDLLHHFEAFQHVDLNNSFHFIKDKTDLATVSSYFAQARAPPSIS